MIAYKFAAAVTVLAGAVVATCSAALARDAMPAYVASAVASVSRPPEDMARDADRRPAETVAYSGIKPGDKVLELMPGGAYYTRILSKVVGPSGEVYAFTFAAPRRPPGAAGATVPAAAAPGATPGGPPAGAGPGAAAYHLSHAIEFKNVTALMGGGPASGVGVPEQVDVVWTSDNYHDFHNKSFGPDIAALNKGIFRDLKPGGTFIVIDHATAAGAGASQAETLHRIDPETVKQEVLAAGFELNGQSDMLAHPADDHTQSVFQLHGKADDFVLRFRKPNTATAVNGHDDSEMQAYYGNTFVIGTPEQRQRTIFFHPDHSYQEFGTEGGITNGLWYLDADGNACMVHQTESSGAGTVACRGLDFPAKNKPKLGDSFAGVDGRAVSLLKGYLYPNAAPPQFPGGGPPPAAAPP